MVQDIGYNDPTATVMFGQRGCIEAKRSGSLNQNIFKWLNFSCLPSGHNGREGTIGWCSFLIREIGRDLNDTCTGRDITVVSKPTYEMRGGAQLSCPYFFRERHFIINPFSRQ